ncbi:MAG: hypothetical protein IIV45_03690 [Lachnospiraceae bacterium]|nr:hypothetical protein [Lachnospiraceae bacterium]
MKISIRKRIIALILIFLLFGNSIQISAEEKDEYSILLWSTTSGGLSSAINIEKIYKQLSADNRTIKCVREYSNCIL